MEKENLKILMDFKIRLLLILILPALVTFYVSDNIFRVHYEFQPLIKDNDPISVEISPARIVQGFLNLDLDFLRYDATFFNNVVSTIGGDRKNYEHELEVFIKYGGSDSEKILTKFGEINILFENETRSKILSDIARIVYLPNINLKPETLTDGNKVLTLNKSIKGNITVDVQLTDFSRLILFLAFLLLEAVLIQTFRTLYQFVTWKY